MNSVTIHGFIGQDPKIEATSGGKKVAKFSVATSEYNDKTEWHNIICWEKKAELIENYFSKGKEILIQGRLETSKWEKEGHTFYRTEIVADRIEFCGSKSDSGGQSAPTGQQPDPELDQIPF